MGLPIFPLVPGRKTPLIKGSFDNATTDIHKITSWWTKWPTANIALATGTKSGILALDIDTKDGKDGFQSLIELQLQHDELPTTVQMSTPSGASQLFFKMPENIHISISADKLASGLDIRANGGYTILPPSKITPHLKYSFTGSYEWFTDQALDEYPLSSLPSWLIDLLKEQPKTEPDWDHNLNKSNIDLDILKVCQHYGITLKQENGRLFGDHPKHGSSNGANFHINPELGLWRCFRHNISGNALQLIALMEDLIDCEQCGRGALRGQLFKDVIAIATEKFGFNVKSLNKDSKGLIWDRNKDQTLKPTFNNTINLLKSHDLHDIRYNSFSSRIEVDGKDIDDDNIVLIKDKLRQFSCEPSVKTIWEAVKIVARDNTYNPVTDYIKSCKWDGEKRLSSWLTTVCGCENNPYSQYVGTLMIVAAVTRAFIPGCKFDSLIILESPQGYYKSTLIRLLAGDKHYTSLNLAGHDKDIVLKCQGNWFIELEEMAAFSKRDINSLKSWISLQVDNERLPYGVLDKRFPRNFICIGTINPESGGYLADKTGNRRFLPIEVKQINIQLFQKIRDHLFGEAYHLYKEGYPLYTNDEKLSNIIKEQQQARETRDEWQDAIINWLNSDRSSDIPDKITCLDVWERCFGGDKKLYDNRTANRIGNALVNLGIEKPHYATYVDGISARWWDISVIRAYLREEFSKRNKEMTDW